jgi:hypothetical protein
MHSTPPGMVMGADVGLTCHGDAEPEPGLAGLAVNARRPELPGWLSGAFADSLREVLT